MFKRIIGFLRKNLHFNIIEVPLIVIFLILISSVYYCVSTLPNEKNNYIAQEISILSKESEIGSVPIYFDQVSKAKLENSAVVKSISNFNAYNNSTSMVKEYKQLVCANLNDKEVVINDLEDKKPAVIMTSWSTFYYDKNTDSNVFMSNLMVEGLGKGQVSDHYFCYITSKQADYLISQDSELYTYNDLINKKIKIQITYDNKTDTKDFLIRDIIKSDVGNDSRYNELFGSYIVCYYIPFLDTTRFQMFYDLSKDENRNLSILNDAKSTYSPEDYSLEFLQSIDEKEANMIKDEFYTIQTMKDRTVLIILLLFVPGLIFALSVFFFSESTKEIRLSLALMLSGAFTIEYVLLYLLVKAKVLFAIKIFTSSGILFSFGLLMLTLLMIAISAFIKENTKFTRKYVHEKVNK